MALARKAAPRPRFLPQGAADAMRRFLVRLGGIVLVAAVLVAAVALATVDPGDPSFNAAVSGPVNNALGTFGATLADLLCQFFGLSAILGLLATAIWGGSLAVRAYPPRLWGLRVALLPLSVLALSVAFSALPLHTASLSAGAGGALGSVTARPWPVCCRPTLVGSCGWARWCSGLGGGCSRWVCRPRTGPG